MDFSTLVGPVLTYIHQTLRCFFSTCQPPYCLLLISASIQMWCKSIPGVESYPTHISIVVVDATRGCCKIVDLLFVVEKDEIWKGVSPTWIGILLHICATKSLYRTLLQLVSLVYMDKNLIAWARTYITKYFLSNC